MEPWEEYQELEREKEQERESRCLIKKTDIGLALDQFVMREHNFSSKKQLLKTNLDSKSGLQAIDLINLYLRTTAQDCKLEPDSKELSEARTLRLRRPIEGKFHSIEFSVDIEQIKYTSQPDSGFRYTPEPGKRTRRVFVSQGDGTGEERYEFEKGTPSNPRSTKIRDLWDKLCQYTDVKKRISFS
ncbi:hypothetical protein KY308_01680 [Candidatus Woesearchaeota archaeon]|nr:hypothetical protein [Candidatus Woesearchaeota archaeon]